LSCSSIVLSLFSIAVNFSSISLSILPSSSSLGPKYSRGGLNGVGCGSIGIGRKGSYGLRGSNLIICHHEKMIFTVSFTLHHGVKDVFLLREALGARASASCSEFWVDYELDFAQAARIGFMRDSSSRRISRSFSGFDRPFFILGSLGGWF
jgi:hypothetical protein